MNTILKKLIFALLITLAPCFYIFSAETSITEIHFLIPGGAGGGWDGTARGTGEALLKSGLVKKTSYENMSGGGGGKAIAHLIETKGKNTLMVNSTPIIIRSLQKVFPQSFRDLTPVAGTIGDYAALIVGKNSKIKDLKALVSEYKKNPAKVAIGGGSVAGSMDHLVLALILKNAGQNPAQVKYIPYDAGGKAMSALLSGEIEALSTGLSEAVELARQGEVKILCVTSPKRVPVAKNAPTCDESGSKGTEFVNWRGFFGPPKLSAEKKVAYVKMFKKMYAQKSWNNVRDRMGWIEIFNSGKDFDKFLEKQEKEIKNLMEELGFL